MAINMDAVKNHGGGWGDEPRRKKHGGGWGDEPKRKRRS